MQKNKYLDDLGIDIKNYGTNFISNRDKRNKIWKEQRALYGFDSRETWCLKYIFAQWLYSHLMMYLEEAGEVVDLSFYKFEHNDKTYTQEEAIKYIIDKTKNYLLIDDDWSDEERIAMEEMQDAIVLFSKIFPAMWW